MAKERIERDDEDLVRLYLTDIGQYPLLTKDDEVRLAQAIEAGREAEEETKKAPKGLTAAKKRELRRAVLTASTPSRRSSSRTSGWSSPSPRSTRPPAFRSST